MTKNNKPQPTTLTNSSHARVHISCHVAPRQLPRGVTSAATCWPTSADTWRATCPATSAVSVANVVCLTNGPPSYDEKATTSMTKLVRHWMKTILWRPYFRHRIKSHLWRKFFISSQDNLWRSIHDIFFSSPIRHRLTFVTIMESSVTKVECHW